MANDNFDLPRPTDAVPSATSAVLNDDAKVLDYVVNSSGTVITRTGKELPTLDEAIARINWAYVGLFADGVTFTSKTDFAADASGTQWIYIGAYPFAAPPGAVPSEPLYQPIRANSHDLLDDMNKGVGHDAIYSRNFKTVADLKAGLSADGTLIAIADIVGAKVHWRGYYEQSDGGSNWGIVKSGAHTDDGVSIFSIDASTYIDANLKGKQVSILKAGAKMDDITFDSQPFIQALFDLDINVTIPLGICYTQSELVRESSAAINGFSNKQDGFAPDKQGSEIRNIGTGNCLTYSDAQTIYDGSLANLKLYSTDGHALHIGNTAVRCKFTDVSLFTQAAGKSCLNKSGAGGGLYSCVFDGGEYGVSTAVRTAAIINWDSPINTINGNTVRNVWVQRQSDIPAINVEITATGGYLYNNVFDTITFEVCSGGAFSLAGNANTVIRNPAMWDTPLYKHNIIHVQPNTHPAFQTTGLRIEGYTRAGDVLDTGVEDIYLGNSVHTTITDFTQTGIPNSSMNLNNTQCTIIGKAADVVTGASIYTYINGNNIITGNITASKISLNKGSLEFSITGGAGSPEGVVFAGRGSIYMRNDGTNATTMYVKMSDISLNSPWVAHAP